MTSPLSKKLIQLYRFLSFTRHRVLYTVFGFTTLCKHNPSCSRYAEEQIREHGTIIGSIKALARIATCW